MAGEIYQNYVGLSSVLFAIARQLSDGTVWNGSTLEAWNNSNIATYDIPLTDQGGGLWTANIPSGLSALDGIKIEIYEQAGGSPVIGDLANYLSSYIYNGSGGSSTVTAISDDVQLILNMLISTMRLKSGETNIYELLDPDSGDPFAEVTLDGSSSPYRLVSIL